MLLAGAGCGASDGDAAGDEGAEPAPRTELTITFWPEGRQGPAQEATLTCDPDGGTHPFAAPACDALRARPGALESLPPDSICTQIFGGPEEAEVAGIFEREEIQATFSRQNGCEIDRWETVRPLLEAAG